MSEEPMSIKMAAIALHEYYTDLRDAGFTRREALALASCLITNKPLEP